MPRRKKQLKILGVENNTYKEGERPNESLRRLIPELKALKEKGAQRVGIISGRYTTPEHIHIRYNTSSDRYAKGAYILAQKMGMQPHLMHDPVMRRMAIYFAFDSLRNGLKIGDKRFDPLPKKEAKEVQMGLRYLEAVLMRNRAIRMRLPAIVVPSIDALLLRHRHRDYKFVDEPFSKIDERWFKQKFVNAYRKHAKLVREIYRAMKYEIEHES